MAPTAPSSSAPAHVPDAALAVRAVRPELYPACPPRHKPGRGLSKPDRKQALRGCTPQSSPQPDPAAAFADRESPGCSAPQDKLDAASAPSAENRKLALCRHFAQTPCPDRNSPPHRWG